MRAPRSLSTISGCSELITWLGGEFPPEGTTFCPTNAALDTFAASAGYRGWRALFEAAQAQPDRWRPFLARVMSFHKTSAAVLPSSQVTAGRSGPFDSLSPARRGADGRVESWLSFSLDRSRSSGRLTLLTPSKQRVPVVGTDMVSVDGSVAVHAVGVVAMPPDTYTTVMRALRSDPALSQTASLLGAGGRPAEQAAGAGATFLAPTNAAWRAMRASGWMGGLTQSAVSGDTTLATAMTRYLTLAPTSDGSPALSRDDVIRAWRLAGSKALLSAPTGLVVGGEAQRLMFAYDEAGDKLYALGARNLAASPAMAGGAVGTRTLYAGTSTVLVSGDWVPLPLRSGVRRLDKVEPPAWW